MKRNSDTLEQTMQCWEKCVLCPLFILCILLLRPHAFLFCDHGVKACFKVDAQSMLLAATNRVKTTSVKGLNQDETRSKIIAHFCEKVAVENLAPVVFNCLTVSGSYRLTSRTRRCISFRLDRTKIATKNAIFSPCLIAYLFLRNISRERMLADCSFLKLLRVLLTIAATETCF